MESAGVATGAGVRRHTVLLLAAGTVGGLLVLGLALAQHADGGRAGAELAAHHTARFSALWFLLAFAAAPLAHLCATPWSRTLLRERRGLGLGFAAAHLVHLGAILLVVSRGRALNAVALIGGGLAYVFVLAMAATSNDRALRALGARAWKRLHTAGAWYLWLIFTQSYVGRLFGADATVAHGAMAALCVLVLGLRVMAAVPRPARAG